MAGSGEKDAKSPASDGASPERATERRMLNASATISSAPDSTRDATSEDFLFHLYRGSELLQDNRVLEAKDELERALTLQPRDPKGQDLLAVVYFRIGLYPRAIQIYEQLKRDNPRDPALKLNLALSYLKTGQAQAARAELEDVVRLHPAHKRAWGYLGLAFERIGELAKAIAAFERAGHPLMARRLEERLAARDKPGRGRSSAADDAAAAEVAEVKGVAAAAFEELDAGEISFSLAEPITGGTQSGTWRAVEPGARSSQRTEGTPPSSRRHAESWTVPPSPEAMASMRTREVSLEEEHESDAAETPLPFPPGIPGGQAAPMPLTHLARAARLIFPVTAGIRLHPSGVALVRTTGGAEGAGARPFAARLESIRVHLGTVAAEVLSRHAWGKSTGESLGGATSAIVSLAGAGDVVLAPRPSHAILPLTLAEEVLTVREDVLLGFELAGLSYENGKLSIGDGESIHMIQIRGTGTVLLELLERLHTLEVTEGRPVLVRRDNLVGWTGPRIVPRALLPAEAPPASAGS